MVHLRFPAFFSFMPGDCQAHGIYNLYLTRASLNKKAPTSALNSLLNPEDPNRALDAHHRLIWTLFPGMDMKRDFLWRAESNGCFYILSKRIPTDPGLFHPISTKEFTPILSPGNKLVYSLRLNATKDKSIPKDQRGEKRRQRVDLVMDELYNKKQDAELEPNDRSEMRNKIASEVAFNWMEKKGVSAGFISNKVVCKDYNVRQFSRGGNNRLTFGILEITGILTVIDPDQFISAIGNGFGRAKAFGCGLMLIRRV